MPDPLLTEIAKHPLREDPQFAPIMDEMPYKYFIDIARDGNCLYASFARLIYPHLAEEHMARRFLGLTAEFERADVSSVVYETYTESLEELLGLSKPREEVSEDEWNLFIGYLRLSASTHLLNGEEKYRGFLPDMDVRGYVHRCVDPMGGHSGQLEIFALSETFGFRTTVFYLTAEGLSSSGCGDGPEIAILHTPGHFEPIFN